MSCVPVYGFMKVFDLLPLLKCHRWIFFFSCCAKKKNNNIHMYHTDLFTVIWEHLIFMSDIKVKTSRISKAFCFCKK